HALAQSNASIAKSVHMKTAHQQGGDSHLSHTPHARGYKRLQHRVHEAQDQPEHKTDQREKNRGAPQFLGRVVHAFGPGEKSQKLQRGEEGLHKILCFTPADSNVAISRRILTAASIKPMARQAPVTSPRRISRSKSG